MNLQTPVDATASNDTSRIYAEFADRLTFRDLSANVVDAVKRLVLDQLAVTLIGSAADGVGTLAKTATDWGGRPEATILVLGGRVPAHHAALVNGTMGRALDYDSVYEKAILHVMAGVFPQGLVMAERAGGVSGQDFVAALAAGMEFAIRLGLSFDTNFLHTGRVTSLHQSTFGGALTAAKLAGLTPDRTVAALGIASAQVSGTLQMAREGSVLVRVQQGLADQASITATILAEQRLGSIERVFQGEFGYFRTEHNNSYNPAALVDGLGARWNLLDTSIKYYPCCFCAHFAIEAIRRLVGKHRFTANEVRAIRVRMTQGSYNAVGAPIEEKRAVTTTEEALFSLPYTVATMLLKGALKPAHMVKPAHVRDPAVRAAAGKISIEVDDELERRYGRGLGVTIVEVELNGGRTHSTRVERCKGHPDEPMTLDDLEDKFWACAPHAARPIERAKLEALVRLVRGIEDVPDVTEIVSLLA